ncbi:MAG: T9SS type A sorting domain-containing protein [Bacteroidales bacterium]|nr:T9SS type A sorting domain-containing protein [Bacteroidales bacterium]
MKTKSLFSLLIGLSIIHLAFTQELHQWHEPVMLTDSLSDNHDPCISTFNSITPAQSIMAWEKVINENTTAICIRELTEMPPTDTVLYEDNVHYLNPEIMKPYHGFPKSEVMYLLIYNRVEGEDHSLAYFEAYDDGTYSEPTEIASAIGDSLAFSAANEIGIAYSKQEEIRYAPLLEEKSKDLYFGEVQVVDTGNCFSPFLSMDYKLCWLKAVDDSMAIMHSAYSFYQDEWSEPEEVYRGQEITGFGGNKKGAFTSLIHWYEPAEPYSKVFYYGLLSGELHEMEIPENTAKSYPTVITYPMITTGFTIVDALIGFVVDSGDNPEIFANNQMYGSYPEINISNYAGMDTKPEMFLGEIGPYWMEILCTWESYRNGHWVIMKNYLYAALGSVEETESTAGDFKLHPNPMDHSATVSYELNNPGPVRISIYDQRGKIIKTLINEEKDSGHHQITWDRTSADGTDVPPGIYLIRFNTGSQSASKKLIVIH